ncbi:MAG: hypothetical protein K9N49_03465 [Candidatus Marinimicrobia bacterium]|nr:hypothetical protein [Candidatus Neomarinimicrobiota bacterium]
MWTRESYGISRAGDRLCVARGRRRCGGVECAVLWEGRAAEAPVDRLRAALARGIPVAAALPTRSVLVRRLSAPLIAARKARGVWPALLDVQLPFPLEECITRYSRTRRAAGQTETLALAVRRNDLEQNCAAWTRLGIEPDLLLPEGLALWDAACQTKGLPARGVGVVLHLESEGGLAVLGADGDFQGAFVLQGSGPTALTPAGLAARVPGLIRARGLDPAHASWLWTGARAAEADFVAELTVALSVGAGQARTAAEPRQFLACALARQALGPTAAAENLRAEPRFVPAATRTRAARRERRRAGIVLAAGLLACATLLSLRILLRARDRAYAGALQTTVAALFPAARIPPGQEWEIGRRLLAEEQTTLIPFQQALAPSLAQTLTTILGGVPAAGAQLQSLTLDDRRIELRAAGGAGEAPGRLAEALRQAGYDLLAAPDGSTAAEHLLRGVRP